MEFRKGKEMTVVPLAVLQLAWLRDNQEKTGGVKIDTLCFGVGASVLIDVLRMCDGNAVSVE